MSLCSSCIRGAGSHRSQTGLSSAGVEGKQDGAHAPYWSSYPANTSGWHLAAFTLSNHLEESDTSFINSTPWGTLALTVNLVQKCSTDLTYLSTLHVWGRNTMNTTERLLTRKVVQTRDAKHFMTIKRLARFSSYCILQTPSWQKDLQLL